MYSDYIISDPSMFVWTTHSPSNSEFAMISLFVRSLEIGQHLWFWVDVSNARVNYFIIKCLLNVRFVISQRYWCMIKCSANYICIKFNSFQNSLFHREKMSSKLWNNRLEIGWKKVRAMAADVIFFFLSTRCFSKPSASETSRYN